MFCMTENKDSPSKLNITYTYITRKFVMDYYSRRGCCIIQGKRQPGPTRTILGSFRQLPIRTALPFQPVIAIFETV